MSQNYYLLKGRGSLGLGSGGTESTFLALALVVRGVADKGWFFADVGFFAVDFFDEERWV